MKRFYCTVCKKIKRTQRWPIKRSFDIYTLPIDAFNRVGVCNRHLNPKKEKVA